MFVSGFVILAISVVSMMGVGYGTTTSTTKQIGTSGLPG